MTVRRSDDRQYVLATAATATGSDVALPGGEYVFMASGTIGGSTLSLQIKLPDGSYADVKSLNGNTLVNTTSLPFAATALDLPACNVRVALTGGTPSNISAWLVGCG